MNAERLYTSEVARRLLDAATQRTPAESSVTISRNARGVVQFEITARSPEIAAAESEALAVFETLSAKYPYPDDSNGGGE